MSLSRARDAAMVDDCGPIPNQASTFSFHQALALKAPLRQWRP